MSLNLLLRLSDDEFEKLLSAADVQSALDIIFELQDAMVKEQERFDAISTALSNLHDKSSLQFTRLSEELIDSQNKLALLVLRNKHCFQLTKEPEDEHDADASLNYNCCLSNRDSNELKGADNSNSTESSTEDFKHKGKSKGADKNLKEQPPHINNLDSVNIPSDLNCNYNSDERKQANSPFDSPRLESTALLSVSTPTQSTFDKKSKRVLTVKTANLSGCNADSPHLLTNSQLRTNSKSEASDSSKTVSSVKSNISHDNDDSTNKFHPLPNCNPSSTLHAFGTSNTVSSINTSLAYDAGSTSLGSISPGLRSPRSDISNLCTPRSFRSLSSPRSDISTATLKSHQKLSPLPVSCILDLDMPETNIDEDERVTLCEELVSDKISCTTDESGFTSASSESDITLTSPDIVFDYHLEDEEKVEERISLRGWDPSKLIDELYKLELATEPSNDREVINMEGYLERLPIGKNKNTLLRTWKQTYCKAIDGILYFYNTKESTEHYSFMSLMGGELEELSNRMIGIDDMRGHYLMVRCAEADHSNWKKSFYTQIKCSPHTNYVHPCLVCADNSLVPKVVIVDIGSTSIRAGILGNEASYPQLFFPSVTSTSNEGQLVVGREAYLPENRVNGIHKPIGTCKDKTETVMPKLFQEIFSQLKINVKDYTILLSTPHQFSSRLKEEILNILITKNGAGGVSMINQSLLTPYIYNAVSGIVVDIGERIEVAALTDGYLVEGTLSRQGFGGTHITDTLTTYLAEHKLLAPVEQLIARLVKEKACFMSQDYGDDLLKYMCNERQCEFKIDLQNFDLPQEFPTRRISIDTARFKASEGLIKTELHGMDSPTLPRLIHNVVNNCPINVRREMWQSIYLSGGTTLTPGFPERLQKELGKIVPSSINVQVHASPHRYHAAYIGACILAKLPHFHQSCISREDWLTNGTASLNKWKT